MSALFILLIACAWLFFSIMCARFFAFWFTQPHSAAIVKASAFCVIFSLPFAYEIIGRWQFDRLCNTEAKIWVSPNAKTINAAIDVGSTTDRYGLIFPVWQQSVKYADLANGNIFYTVTGFHARGLVDGGFGQSTACWPDGWRGNDHGIDITGLINRGRQVQMLELYGAQLRKIRSPIPVEQGQMSKPEPSPLVGVSRDAVFTALGEPDSCQSDEYDPRLRRVKCKYWFFQKTDVYNKWILDLRFDSSGIVERAEWLILN